MTKHTDLSACTAAELMTLFDKRKASPVEALDAVLKRVDAVNPRINAISHLDAEGARKAARASEKRWKKGEALSPLDGVPASIKELIRVRGWPTLMGSKMVDPAGPWDIESPAVTRLREGGAVLFAQTTSPEYGHKGVTESPLHGITRNPWNLAKTPGGSSGGSAAAVVAGMGPISLGTDGGGSVRLPAAFCGLVGLKATFGRVPAWPPSLTDTLANTGPMTRTALDAAMTMNLIGRYDAMDDTALPDDGVDYVMALKGKLKGLKAAWIGRIGDHWIDPEVEKNARDAARTVKSLGVKLVEREAPDTGAPDPRAVWWTHWIGAEQRLLSMFPAEKHASMDESLRWMADEGRKVTSDQYVEARQHARRIGQAWNLLLAEFDVVLMPTLAVRAFDTGMRAPDGPDGKPNFMWSPYTALFNLTRHPAISVPSGLTSDGLPTGLQIVAAHGRDALLLRVADKLLAERPFRVPPLPAA
ncbi:MAG: amidase [Rhodospirillales bacterium]|nr:amidase [Rhodospirillales bacterium]